MNSIFLIDDDADDRSMFCEALEEVSPNVVCNTAENGSAGLNALRNKEIELPDVIFLDINMPVMGGWQCLTILKSDPVFKDIPVLMYSTSSNPEDIRKAKQLGGHSLVTKPCSFQELKKILEKVVTSLEPNTSKVY